MNKLHYNYWLYLSRNGISNGSSWSNIKRENFTQVFDEIERTFKLFQDEEIERIKISYVKEPQFFV